VQNAAADVAKSSGFDSASRRRLALFHHFLPCLTSSRSNSLHEVPPYAVAWNRVAVCVHNSLLAQRQVMALLNCSLVALCHYAGNLGSLPRIGDGDEFGPHLVEDSVPMEFVGYAIIRAIDVSQHLFYLITPLDDDRLEFADAIVTGNLRIPTEFFFMQKKSMDIVAPYVGIKQVSTGKTDHRIGLLHKRMTMKTQHLQTPK